MYFVVCNPCEEQVIAVDDRLLNKDGITPVLLRKLNNNEYVPIIIYTYYGKIYKCPRCNASSGIAAPREPRNLKLFSHNYMCFNKNKFPTEQ